VEADFGYTGHLIHERSGFVVAPFRFYDSTTARWLSRDPIGENGGINLYGYVSNNTINLIDPTGLWTFEIGLSLSAGLGIIGGGLEGSFVIDSDLGFGMKGSATGRLGPQLGVDISPYVSASSASQITDLRGDSLGAFIDAWKLGSFSCEFAGGNSELTRDPKVQMPIIGGQYGNFGPGFLIGAGVQASKTGVWRWW
jgi:RHS repeat-associated protein